jgi:hypothetical protein
LIKKLDGINLVSLSHQLVIQKQLTKLTSLIELFLGHCAAKSSHTVDKIFSKNSNFKIYFSNFEINKFLDIDFRNQKLILVAQLE